MMTTEKMHQLSFTQVLVGAASLVAVIAGMWFLASFIGPVLLALFIAILLYPVLHWLQKKGLGTGLALLIVIVLVIGLGLALFALVIISFDQLAAGLSAYQIQLDGRVSELQAWLADQGLTALTVPPLAQTINSQQIIESVTAFLSRIGDLVVTVSLVVMTLIFAIVEIPVFGKKVAENLGADSLLLRQGTLLSQSVVRYFGLRALVNLITGAEISLFLFVLGVDFALLWGVLTFFLSFIPYIGIIVATIPAVLLAWAEFGPGRAILVIIGVMIANGVAENIVSPKLIGKGLKISPLVVFLSFFFWSWVLGPLGMLLSMPLTVIVLLVLDSFDETRWLARTISAMPAAEAPQAEIQTTDVK
jgi:predicted PurR-regulated permease PerM